MYKETRIYSVAGNVMFSYRGRLPPCGLRMDFARFNGTRHADVKLPVCWVQRTSKATTPLYTHPILCNFAHCHFHPPQSLYPFNLPSYILYPFHSPSISQCATTTLFSSLLYNHSHVVSLSSSPQSTTLQLSTHLRRLSVYHCYIYLNVECGCLCIILRAHMWIQMYVCMYILVKTDSSVLARHLHRVHYQIGHNLQQDTTSYALIHVSNIYLNIVACYIHVSIFVRINMWVFIHHSWDLIFYTL